MGLHIFTLIHAAISLLALLAGIPVVAALSHSRIATPWTSAFLVLAILASLTGFLFPIHGLTPALTTGIVACLVFAVVLMARYSLQLGGAGRWLYAVGMVISLYLLVFVAIAQAFQEIGLLRDLAPTGKEAPFAIVQLVVLIGFAALAVRAARRFRPRPAM